MVVRRGVCHVSSFKAVSFKAVSRKGCEEQEVSRANQIKRKWQHQKRVSREKKCQAERVPRTDAVNHGDNRAVWRRSYRLSLFFIAFPLGNFGLAALYWTIYRGFPIAIFHYQRVYVERQRVLIQHNTV